MENLESLESILEKKRKFSFSNWISNKSNLLFVILIIAAIIVRVYFLVQTQGQPLWWDESEYALRAKAFAFNTPLTGWAPERELVFPFLFSILFRIGLGEGSLRMVEFLISVLTVFSTYFVISNLSNKKVGLIATFGMAFFWLHLFFSQRILIYPVVPLLYLITIHLFHEGYIKNRKKHFIAFPIFSALALMTYFSEGFLLFGIFLYLLLVEGFSLFKNKKAWKTLLIFFITLLPFAIYFQFTYGFPIPRLAIGYQATTTEYGAGLSGLLAYVNMIPSRVGLAFTFLGVVGIIYFLSLFFLGWGVEGNIKKNKEWLLIFTAFFVPFVMYTLYGTVGGSGTFYDGFILGVFPFFFALSGLGLEKIYEFVAKYHKQIAIILVIIILGMHLYSGVKNADYSIKARLTSYDSVKAGGLWIKDNSNPDDSVISASLPQNTYYSERKTFSMQHNETQLLDLIEKEKPKYFVDSIWEPIPDWVHQVTQNHPEMFKPVHGYFADASQTQTTLIVYEIQY